MADTFVEALGKRLFIWSGWIFTIFGAAGSFVLGQATAWIGWLVLATGVVAITAHTLACHRLRRELEQEKANLAAQLREAERKLNEVPLDLVNRIHELVAPRSVTDIAARLAAHADTVIRMSQFAASVTGAIQLRTFTMRDNCLYAIAKVAEKVMSHLREEDVFILVHAAEGLRTDCAIMIVHQRPDPKHGVVYLRVMKALSDDVRTLEQLTATRNVSGLTGYTLRTVL